MTRAIIWAILLATALFNAPAQAQNGRYCLMTGPAQECAYDTLDQCLASKHGNTDFCEPNNRASNRPY
jgi:hypothetical protein